MTRYVPLANRRRPKFVPFPLWEGWWDSIDLPKHDNSNLYRRPMWKRALWRIGFVTGRMLRQAPKEEA